ncbi:hypothetical protein BHE74_00001743 [Ensete ventricosum]|nr:hypothetical protein GW17_00004842 [Ensete ventricosum]RWW89313.1 hypothetical protein BHE74_00001743 [Ensete ventricosum]
MCSSRKLGMAAEFQHLCGARETNSTVPESNGAGDGDPMTLTVAAGSTECSTAGVQPKVKRRKRSRARDPGTKHQTTSRPSKRLRTVGLCLAAVDAIPELMDGKACSTCWPEIPVREASLDRHRLSNFTTMHTP